jgi:hypothetical protein
MPEQSVVPIGNLNLDVDIARIKDGDYSNALDITFITDEGGSSVSAENQYGNKFSFKLGSVVPQVKKFVINMPSSTIPNDIHSATVFRSNGLPWFSFNFYYLSTQAATILDFESEFISEINVAASSPPFPFQSSLSGGVYSIWLAQDGLDWNILIDGVPQTIIQEPVGKPGIFKPIGSSYIDNDLFVWSCVTDDEPLKVDVVNSQQLGQMIVVNTVPFANPYIGLQHVYISGTNNGMDGAWLAQNSVGSPFSFLLIGSQWTVNSSGGTILIGTEAIGELGVAQYTEGTDSYTYTRLARSRKFNFVSKHQIDARPTERNIRSTNFYWTDNYNQQRCMYYKGAYIQDGFISYFNPLGLYEYQTLNEEIRSQVIANFKVQFVSQDSTGGAVKAGNHRYVVRARSGGRNKTEISLPSGLVNVYAQPNSNLALGSEVGTVTPKINNLLITNIPPGVFEEIELIDILYSSSFGLISATVVNIFPLGIDDIELKVSHTGNEAGSFGIDSTELQYITEIYKTVKSNQVIDNRMVNTNVTLYEELDLSEFFKTWKHSIIRQTINDSGNFFSRFDIQYNSNSIGNLCYPSKANLAYGEYQNPSNVNSNMSLMLNETYRFMAVCKRKDNGQLTSAFWIDDICVNNRGVNENALGLPITVNRRVATVADADIVVPASGAGSIGFQNVIFAYDSGALPGSPLIYNYGQIYYAGHGLQTGDTVFVANFTGAGAVANGIDVGAYFTVSVISSDTFNLNGWVNAGNVFSVGLTSYWATAVAPSGNLPQNYGWNNLMVYSYGVEFSGFDLAFQIDGKPFYELFDEIYIFRADCVPEILYTGVLVPSVSGRIYVPEYKFGHGDGGLLTDFFDAQGSHPYQSGGSTDQEAYNSGDYTSYPAQGTGGADYEKYTAQCAFYSPDHDMVGNNVDRYFASDIILNYGPMSFIRSSNGLGKIESGGKNPWHLDTAMELAWLQRPQYPNIMQNFTGAGFVEKGGVYTNQGFPNYVKKQVYIVDPSQPNKGTTNFDLAPSWFFDLNQPLWTWGSDPIQNGYLDTICYGQYYRPKAYDINNPEANKYGSFKQTVSYYTGFSLNVQQYSTFAGQQFPTNIVQVYGGDVYNQKYFHKVRIPVSTDQSGFVDTTYWVGGGGALIYYSQNRHNARMIRDVNGDGDAQFPISNYGGWLSPQKSARPVYDPTYDYWTSVKQKLGYSTDVRDYAAPSRTVYSALKPQDGTYDGYRDFQPLDFLDVPLTDGEITHHEKVNGELFIQQVKKWLKYFFNTRGELQVTGNSTSIAIGDGSVLSRPPIELSAYGSRNKWSFIKGKSVGGQEVVYIFDLTSKAIIRYAGDGTRNISLENNIDSFIRNNTRFLDGVDTPAWKYGIAAVWNEKRKVAIWTARAINPTKPIWFVTLPYQVGDIVWFGDNNTDAGWEQLPAFFECIQANNGSLSNKPLSGADWQDYWVQLPLSDNRVYNVWTLEFNELKNGFSTFGTPKPKIYMPFRNTVLTGDPRVSFSLQYEQDIYEQDNGEKGVWYDYRTGEGLYADGFIELVFNSQTQDIKHYLALRVNSLIKPFKFELFTKKNQTFMLASDVEEREDLFFTAVKNDSNTPPYIGQNDQDTSAIFGQYVKIKMYFEKRTRQYLTDLMVRFKFSPRNSNK